ncbi:MAG: transposase, partial [Anaerolineales bacterium]
NNGRLEGLNNKIKVIKRRCYGFHDLDYFALKIMQASPRSRSP